MSKRKRGGSGGSVTGGTGDVKPQYMTLGGAIAAAVDDYRIDVFQVPVVRPRAQGESATIMEILSLDWYLDPRDLLESSTTHFGYLASNTPRTSGDTATLATMSEDLGDPRNVGCAIRSANITTSGITLYTMPIHIDLTDDNGNGFLWANDTITMVKGAIADTTVSETICKLKYRWVNVGLIEYLGIVQTQSS